MTLPEPMSPPDCDLRAKAALSARLARSASADSKAYLDYCNRREWDRIDGIADARRLSVSSFEWAQIRGRVFQRDNFTCTYCGAAKTRLECDHIIPVSSGGSDDISNLTTACRPCNRSKGAKSIQEWNAP